MRFLPARATTLRPLFPPFLSWANLFLRQVGACAESRLGFLFVAPELR